MVKVSIRREAKTCKDCNFFSEKTNECMGFPNRPARYEHNPQCVYVACSNSLDSIARSLANIASSLRKEEDPS